MDYGISYIPKEGAIQKTPKEDIVNSNEALIKALIEEILKNYEFSNGANGENGKDGVNGKSAYELWLELGNEGSLEDFLTSLKGKDGLNAEVDTATLKALVKSMIQNSASGANLLAANTNPKIDTNPEFLGTLFVNTEDLNLFTCTDNTKDLNVWKSLLDNTIIKAKESLHIYKFDLLAADKSSYGVCLSGVVLYNQEGQRLYLKNVLRDSAAKNPVSTLLFSTQKPASVGTNLSKDYEPAEDEILASITCEERYNNGNYYQVDYVFNDFVENAGISTLVYYMSNLKTGSVTLKLIGEKNKLSKLEFRAGITGRLTSKMKILYFYQDREGVQNLVSESEEFNPVDTSLMQVVYEDLQGEIQAEV